MSSPGLSEFKIRFGEFAADLEAGELYRNGTKIKLQGQPFQILALLLKHPGRIVSREELRRELWPTDTFVDFEHGLNAAVNRLRDAFGDSAENPRFIETLQRRGYRFIYRLDSVPELEASGSTLRVGPTRMRWIAAVMAVLLAALTLAVGLNVAGLRNRLLRAFNSKGLVDAPRIDSIAVLPFENLSGDPAQEYFADGMTDELITDLGKTIPKRVISRTSVMCYKGSRKPLPEIARELNVDAVVEGTVQRSGSQVRVTANLLHGPTDRHLWADSYESELGNVLVLQGKLARSIADEIGIKLIPQQQIHLASIRPVNAAAHQSYLEGKYYASKLSEEGFRKAVVSFREAIHVDPGYAAAYEGLAGVYFLMGIMYPEPSTTVFPLGEAAALKALELDDGLAEAHADLGLIKLVFDWDWSGAEQELQRAIILNPNSSDAHFSYSMLLMVVGRSDEAVREARKAVELDPLTPTTNDILAQVFLYARLHDESIVQLQKTLQLAPDFGYAYAELGQNYAQKRMYPEAVAACRRAVSLAPEDGGTVGRCGYVYGLASHRQDALAILEQLKKLSTRAYMDPYNVAFVYDGLGENDRTMEWLERAFRERSCNLHVVKVEQWSDGLRSDSRFQALLRRMNFPQ